MQARLICLKQLVMSVMNINRYFNRNPINHCSIELHQLSMEVTPRKGSGFADRITGYSGLILLIISGQLTNTLVSIIYRFRLSDLISFFFRSNLERSIFSMTFIAEAIALRVVFSSYGVSKRPG